MMDWEEGKQQQEEALLHAPDLGAGSPPRGCERYNIGVGDSPIRPYSVPSSPSPPIQDTAIQQAVRTTDDISTEGSLKHPPSAAQPQPPLSPDKASPPKKVFAAAPKFEGLAPDRIPQPKQGEAATEHNGTDTVDGDKKPEALQQSGKAASSADAAE